jgi:hypothetical protein
MFYQRILFLIDIVFNLGDQSFLSQSFRNKLGGKIFNSSLELWLRFGRKGPFFRGEAL